MKTIIIRTFDNYFIANLILTRLRDSGLECYLKDEYTVTIDPLLSNAIGGIKIIVKEKDLAFANALLREFDEGYRNAVTCPDCGSHDITLMPKQNAENLVTAITTWLFSSYAISVENVYKCNVCGFESEVLPETKS